MKTRHQTDNPRQEDSNADYNPTERNFDQTDVAGAPDAIGGNAGRGKNEESDPPLTELDLEETALSDEESDNMKWEKPGTSDRESGRMAREQDGPVK